MIESIFKTFKNTLKYIILEITIAIYSALINQKLYK